MKLKNSFALQACMLRAGKVESKKNKAQGKSARNRWKQQVRKEYG